MLGEEAEGRNEVFEALAEVRDEERDDTQLDVREALGHDEVMGETERRRRR